MGTLMDINSAQSVDLKERARAGDREALNALLAHHRDRLRRMVEIGLDTRLQACLDASDVVQEALNTLDPMDREVLSLRHFEELTAAEAAQVLGIEESAAAKRYFRALKRLKEILAALLGGQGGV
jgi:RNA polymerase sigma factor (sigma-70 family)